MRVWEFKTKASLASTLLVTVSVSWAFTTSSASAQMTVDYAYDELNRLVEVVRDDGPIVTYTHDVVSNITSETVTNSPDTDGDQVGDFADLDDDNDLIPDDWELQYLLDPLNPADAAFDLDGDGDSALVEFQNGTDPTDPASNSSSGGPTQVQVPMPLWGLVLLATLLAAIRFRSKGGAGLLPAFVAAVLLSGIPDGHAQSAEELVVPDAPRQEAGTLAEPGWYVQSASPVSPDQARQVLGISSETEAPAIAMATTAFATPSDYTELAEALENDPRRIYQYVRNHFEYVPYYGALKGPYLTLHERSGNDFDQAALLIELLRAAGYTANFRYGVASVPTGDAQQLKQLADWLGTDEDVLIIVNTFSNGGVPVELTGGNIEFDHVWVEATLPGGTIPLDPSFKLSEKSPVIDLDAAMGYNQASLLAAAGGTLGANSIEGMNEAGLASHLATLTSQLNAYLKANHPNDRIEDVIGGFTIIPDLSADLPPSLPLPVAPSFAPWSSIPTAYIHTVRLQHGGIDTTLDIPYIAGRKLSVSYAGDSVTIPPPPAGATDFGSVAIGQDGPTYTWTPTNNNSVVIQVTSSITGSGASAYSFVAGGGTKNIPANGGSIDVKVKFSGVGQTAGRKDAVLHFDYSYQGNPIGSQTVDLTGVVEADRVAELYLDDVLEVSEGSPSGNLNDFVVTVDHPYASNGGTFQDQSVTFSLDRSGSYVLASGFGGDKHSTLLGERQRLLNRMSLEGNAPDSREMLSETLNVIGQTWLQQTQLNADLLGVISGVRQMSHHRFGIVGQAEGYYVDVKAQSVSLPKRVAAPEEGVFQAGSFIASAMEHSVLEQLQGADNPGISTINIIALNNQNGDRLFLANSGNYATVQGQLSNYTAGDLSDFQSLVNAGHTLILPENGAVILNDWSGKGYVDYNVSGTSRSLGMIIGGGLNGGFASLPQAISPYKTTNEFSPEIKPQASVPTPTAADPVDLGSGAFLSSMTDLSLGGSGPRGLSFTRTYNSQQAVENSAGLGNGWNHSYNISLTEHSDVESALGEGTAFQAAPLIVASHLLRDLMAPEQPSLQYWAVGALIGDWAVDQLLNKSMTVNLGNQASTYRELPDGSFVPPAGVTTDLVRLADGTFELRERFGTVMKFNADRKIQSLTDIDGNVLTFGYAGELLTLVTDTFGRSLTLGYAGDQLTSVSDSTGRTVTYNQTGGNLTGVNGLESANWQYSYDSLHRLLTVTDPVNNLIVSNTYNDFDRVVQQLAPRETGTATYRMHYTGVSSSEEDPLGNRQTYYYELTGRTIAVEDALGNITRTQYDGQGQVLTLRDAKGNETTFAYDEFNNRIASIDSLSNTTTFLYDAQHRFTTVIDALTHTAEIDYDAEHHPIATRDGENNEATIAYRPDGLVDTQTDPRLVTTTTTYDAHGYPATSLTGSQPAFTTVYDSLGRMLSLTDQAGTVTGFTYDDRGLVTRRTDAFSRDTTSLYDGLGHLVSQTDRNGDTVTTGYTASGKLDTLAFPGYGVSFAYDNRDNLTGMTDPLGTTSNTYDALNRLISHTDPNGFAVGYDYDAAGNLTRITYPGNKTVSYGYDTLNRVNAITIDWLGETATPTYDAAGRLTGITHFNGTSTAYSFDNADRLIGLTHSKSGQIIADYQYTLDPNGNRTRVILDNEPILPATLINKSETQAYNAYKNRLTSATLDAGPVSFGYDNEGQLQSKGTTGFTFDSAHRLTGYGSNSYQYDGIGNRLIATRNGVTTKYLYDAAGNLLAEADGSNVIQRYYIHGIGLMAMVDAQTNQLYVYHYDGTGHTVAMTDGGREIINRYAYGPYGRILGKEETIPQPFTYVGQYGVMTEANDLYYMRARYYDAEVGRFISEDPIGFAGGLNLYAYVGGNPVNAIDPSGTIVCGGLCVTAIGIGVGLAFDYAIDAIRGSDNSTAATVGNAATGGAVAVTVPTQTKPRTGISGGGPSGSGTSVASQINHSAGRGGLYSVGTRNTITKVLRKVPYVGTGIAVYQLGDAVYDRYGSGGK